MIGDPSERLVAEVKEAQEDFYTLCRGFYERLSDLAGEEIDFNWLFAVTGQGSINELPAHLDPTRIRYKKSNGSNEDPPIGPARLSELKIIAAAPATGIMQEGQVVDRSIYADPNESPPIERQIQGIDAVPVTFCGVLVPHQSPETDAARVFSHAIGIPKSD